MSIFKKTVMTLACLALFAISAHASATNIYIAQNGAGAANGADCADALPVSFFNNSGNWGSARTRSAPEPPCTFAAPSTVRQAVPC